MLILKNVKVSKEVRRTSEEKKKKTKRSRKECILKTVCTSVTVTRAW